MFRILHPKKTFSIYTYFIYLGIVKLDKHFGWRTGFVGFTKRFKFDRTKQHERSTIKYELFIRFYIPSQCPYGLAGIQ